MPKKHPQRVALPVSLAFVLGCGGPPTVEPEVSVALSPSKVSSDGKPAIVTVQTTDELGKPGKGSVYVESSAGSLSGGATLPLDAQGTASTELTCDVKTDAACGSDVVIVSAKWKTAKGRSVSATFSSALVGITVAPPPCDGSVVNGSWKRADGLTWVMTASQCALHGTAEVTGFTHAATGTYNPSSKTWPWPVTRTNTTTHCSTVMTVTATLLDPTHIRMSCTGTDGRCELPASYTETSDYTKL